MSNYFDKYQDVTFNDIKISNICHIQNITEPLLTSLDIDTLDIRSVDGETFNGAKKNTFEIEITVLVDCDTQEEYDQALNDLKDAFDVKEPKPFYINEDKFIVAIPVEGIVPEEKEAFYSREFTIKLLCLSPYWYSNDTKVFNNEENDTTKTIVSNEGKKEVYPFISLGFSKDAHFVQVENGDKKILVGKYPELSLPSKEASSRVLYERCESTLNFIDSTASIDGDRSGGGTLMVTSDGDGIGMASPGNGDTTWKGIIKRLNLTKEVDEFKLQVNMRHNSTGKNGDPSDKFITDSEKVESGERKLSYYKVTCNGLNYRTGAGTSYKSLGTLKKGFQITGGTAVNGWLKFKYTEKTSKDCYASMKYLEAVYSDNTVTTYNKNFVTIGDNSNSDIVYLREQAKKSSKALATIPKTTIVRCNTKEYVDSSTNLVFYKLATKYEGKIGYICKANLIEAGDVSITYPEDEIIDTADDKLGMIECYGFDTNGQKLFKLGMYDDNPYLEYTYPRAEIGGKEVLKDNTKLPDIKKKYELSTSGETTTIKVTNRLMGKAGDWNEFYGQWFITREKINDVYQWNITLQKITKGEVVKTQSVLNSKDNSYPTEKLAYLVLYIGTTGTMEKSSAMSFTHFVCNELNPQSDVEANETYFTTGDVLEIDCDNTRNVYLNGEERNDLLDIGSRFFTIETGDTEIKTVSDDNDISTSIAIREKF